MILSPTEPYRLICPQPVLVSWSGGKDSCYALQELLRVPEIKVEALLTTVTRDFDRVSMHGVRSKLVEQQAQSLGLPLHQVQIPQNAANSEYESRMAEAFRLFTQRGIATVVFGDLFLEDIRAYRDAFLARHGMTGLYPVWKRNTASFIREFVSYGFQTIVVCVDPKRLDASFAGRVIDEEFLRDLPPNVDPCGENGEFHTFVFDGPIFRRAVEFSRGDIVCRDSFCFCDLVPGT